MSRYRMGPGRVTLRDPRSSVAAPAVCWIVYWGAPPALGWPSRRSMGLHTAARLRTA